MNIYAPFLWGLRVHDAVDMSRRADNREAYFSSVMVLVKVDSL